MMTHTFTMHGPNVVELMLFSLLTVVIIILFFQFRRQRASPYVPPPRLLLNGMRWLGVPEIRLVVLALPIQLLWEVAQFPLYDVWHENSWSYILYGLIHCTLGDVLIMLSAYWLVAFVNRSRYWYRRGLFRNGLLFTLIGAGYTIYSEIVNVHIKQTWGYTELMPIVPVIEIGGMPFLQWLLIPPVLLGLMRLLTHSVASRSFDNP